MARVFSITLILITIYSTLIRGAMVVNGFEFKADF